MSVNWQRFTPALLSSVNALKRLIEVAQECINNGINEQTEVQAQKVKEEMQQHGEKIDSLIEAWETKTKRNDQEIMEFIEAENPFSIVARASDLSISIEVECNALKRKLLSVKTEVDQAVTKPEVSISHLPVTRLPFEKLNKFNGDKTKWDYFLTSFESLVGQQPGSKVQKLSILFNHLEGTARQSVQHFGLTEANYEIVLDALKEKYGNQEDQYELLLTSLSQQKPNADVDNLRKTLAILCQLNTLPNGCDARSVKVAFKKSLPLFAYKRWIKEYPTNGIVSIPEMIKFIDLIIKEEELVRERFPEKFKKLDQQQATNQRSNWKTTSSYFNANQSTNEKYNHSAKTKRFNVSCVFCGAPHWSDNCDTASSYQQRMNIVQERNLCINCLGNHFRKDCTRVKKCYYCQQRHHSSLCKNHIKGTDTHQPVDTNIASNDGKSTSAQIERGVVMSINDNQASPATIGQIQVNLLMCAYAQIKSVEQVTPQTSIKVPVMFDTGSQHSYIASWASSALNLPYFEPTNLELSTFGAAAKQRYQSYQVQFSIDTVDNQPIRVTAFTMPKIVDQFDWINVSNINQSELEKGKLDLEVQRIKPVILIGCDYYEKFFQQRPIELPSGFTIYNSRLGRFIAGSGWAKQSLNYRNGNCITSVIAASLHDPDDIDRFWKLESVGLDETSDQTFDDFAVQQFNERLRRLSDGRYQVAFPWRNIDAYLPDNYGLAYGRLKSTIKVLRKRSENLVQEYDDIIQEQLASGIIERVTAKESVNKITYIPHHPVISTKKIRIVFDASAKQGSEKSVNELLLRGPVIMNDLTGILIRTRMYPSILLADIEKAFHQIALEERDRDITRFLWLKNRDQLCAPNNIEVYRFRRVPFGFISSPFLLNAVIRHHFRESNIECKNDLLSNIYVDNVLIGFHSQSAGIKLYSELKENFAQIHMNLCTFMSSDEHLMKSIPEKDRDHRGEDTEILGVKWNRVEDVFSTTITKPNNIPNTKRLLLRFIAEQYDPFGVISPSMLSLKLILQKVWKDQYTWDQTFAPERMTELTELFNQWNPVTSFLFSRNIGRKQFGWNHHHFDQATIDKSVSLHIFTDASCYAIGVCIYLRVEEEKEAKCSLIFAKSRLLPKTANTIPRAELQAAVIGHKCAKFTLKQLPFAVNRVVLWTDSTCVLAWLHTSENCIKHRYVQNRINELQTFNGTKRYVPTHENPADIGSRGMLPTELSQSNLWWEGPEWLKDTEKHWPSIPVTGQPERCIETTVNIANWIDQISEDRIVHFERFNRFTKLRRVIGWVVRFIEKLKGMRGQPKWMTARELNKALWILIKLAQQHIREGDIQRFVLKREDGIYQCYGRTTKPLIFLPNSHIISHLIIFDAHQDLMHGSTEVVIARLMNKFWMPKFQRTVKKVISRQCMQCRVDKAKPFRMPIMGTLPDTRVTRTLPFQHVGVDFAGPVIALKDQRKIKCWILIFSCFSTRAIHLELLDEMSTQAYFQGFRRLVALRGTPSTIYSDNAKSFLSAKRILDSIREQTEKGAIEWRFITEYAPWQGGVYERMIGIAKSSLRTVIRKELLSFEHLCTILYEVACTVNQRPLYGMNADDMQVVRPCDLMMQPTVDVINTGTTANVSFALSKDLADNLELNRRVLDNFWKVWKTKYCRYLQSRSQKLDGPRSAISRIPRIGELVWITSEAPRSTWKLSKIKEVIPSADGRIRSVLLSLPNGKTTRRTINLICPLELE